MRKIYTILMITLLLFSCKLKEEPDEDVIDPTQGTKPKLNVVQPSAGDTLISSSAFEIKWESSDLPTNLTISFTSDNGKNWNVIESNVNNDGSLVWSPIPKIVSSQCRIKMVAADSSITSLSTGLFSIAKSANIYLSLVTPNGGELYTVDNYMPIQWTYSGIDNIRIDFSPDNGSNWYLIAPNFPVDSLQYFWQPGNDYISQNCLIKITDVQPNGVFDISDSSFQIIKPEYIKVNSPDGGEFWQIGTSKEIIWLSEQVANVKIEYTTNNGLNWFTLTESTPSDGYYEWSEIPSQPSSLMRVKITDSDDGYPSDQSDNVFSITPEEPIVVTYPNGNEILYSGNTYTITWNSIGNSVSSNLKLREAASRNEIKAGKISASAQTANIKIELSTNNGANWETVVESTPNNGSYNWTNVPSVNSELCRVRISDADDSIPSDISNNPFTILASQQKYLKVNEPNGGEGYEAGTLQNIKWVSSNISKINIYYSTNNGLDWNTLVTDTESDGFYSWNGVPATASTNCLVKIQDSDNTEVYDLSDDVFSILPEKEIMVTMPDGGEVFQSGIGYDIKWTSNNITAVKIEYSTNSGATWSVITNSVESSGIYNWNPVPEVNSMQCRVKISDAFDGVPYDISNENFQIKNQVTESLSLTSPNGSETWEAGTQQTITWEANAISRVTLEYTSNNGLNWDEIVSGLQSTGSYEWNVPDLNSTQCKVRIKDANDSSPVDESDGLFTIKPVPSLSIISPNGGESFIAGQPVNILWNSTGVENVKIEYTVNNGISPEDWHILVSSTPSDGLYETGFSIASEKYRIRISESVSGTPIDESNGTFTINPQPGIAVESPNGGEDWLTGTVTEIRWDATNIDSVDIQYSLDGGANWKEIVNNIPSNGIYNWHIPESIDFRSDLCLIKIMESGDGSPNDVSDNFFTIHPEDKLLRWTFPNGGEYIYAEEDQLDTLITWNSAGIDFVDIEYTSDNGMTWLPIVNNYHSTGAYVWTIPFGPPSTLARIRIIDSQDASYTDMSDSHFNLRIKQGINSKPEEIINDTQNHTLTFEYLTSGSNDEIEVEMKTEGYGWRKVSKKYYTVAESNITLQYQPKLKGTISLRLNVDGAPTKEVSFLLP